MSVLDGVPRVGAGLERAWLAPVALAAVATAVTAPEPAVFVLLAVACLPWVFGVLGKAVPSWVFGVFGLVPVAVIVTLAGLDASIFLGTTTLTLLASRAARSWQISAAAVVGVLLPFAAYTGGPPFDLGAIYFGIGNLFGIVCGVLLGRTRRLGEELRAADARLAAGAAQDERTELARDVHDLVAHSLTVVVLHIGGARRVLRADPAAAEAALDRAERVCRESLDGMRQVVGLLRDDDAISTASLDLPGLVQTYRAASVDVDLTADGEVAGLPMLVRGTVYRVVREALANAARYRAPGSVVEVRVRLTADGVSAIVSNQRSAADGPGLGGYGLTGLREQVTAVGGTLTSGPSGDRWRVECHLPRAASAVPVGSVPVPAQGR